MAISSPFPYTFKEPYQSVTCIFKLWFGSKYFIFKGLKLHSTAESLSIQIHRELNRPKEDSILFKAIAYIKRARIITMSIEVIHETDAISELLMVEYEQLQKAKKDLNCLNTRFTNNEYYPKWIPQSAINDFTKQLQGSRMPDKHKNLRRFLSKYTNNPDNLEKIYEYIVKNFR